MSMLHALCHEDTTTHHFKLHSRKAHSIQAFSFIWDAMHASEFHLMVWQIVFFLRTFVCVCLRSEMSIFYAYVFDRVEWIHIFERLSHKFIDMNNHKCTMSSCRRMCFHFSFICSFLSFLIFIFKYIDVCVHSTMYMFQSNMECIACKYMRSKFQMSHENDVSNNKCTLLHLTVVLVTDFLVKLSSPILPLKSCTVQIENEKCAIVVFRNG